MFQGLNPPSAVDSVAVSRGVLDSGRSFQTCWNISSVSAASRGGGNHPNKVSRWREARDVIK